MDNKNSGNLSKDEKPDRLQQDLHCDPYFTLILYVDDILCK